MTAAPPLDEETELQVLRFRFFMTWRVERDGRAWTAVPVSPVDAEVRLAADSAGELAMAMMHAEWQRDLRRAMNS